MLSRRPIRVLRRKLSAQRKRNQEKNDEPTGMQIDGDAENASQSESGGRRGILNRNRRWAGCRSEVRTGRGGWFVRVFHHAIFTGLRAHCTFTALWRSA